MIKDVSERLSRLRACGDDPENAWNLNSVVLTKAAEAHCHYYMVLVFESIVENTEDDGVKEVLRQLCQLFAVFGIHENSGDFIQVMTFK